MLLEWIDQQLKERGLPRKALIEAVPTLTEKKISEIFSGDRRLQAHEADDIRRYFGYRLPHDPVSLEDQRTEDLLARLDAGQKQTVVLYLEALLGASQAHPQAS